ncbi:MAG: 4-hydroxy-3-methylbut-2-enyl diphosphate reductase [Acidiferrobacter sp.]
MRVYVASPRGFCAGVERAVAIVDRVLAEFGAPVYVRHEVVHNHSVVESLRARGAVFVEALIDVPRGGRVIFSAHGVAQAVWAEARARGLQVFDATCPLVLKVHSEVTRWRKAGYECLLIGHAGHPEVEGTLGQVADGVYLIEAEADVARVVVRDPARVAFVTQTTLSVGDTQRIINAIRARFAMVRGPHTDDICYATQNRQDAVRALAADCAVVIVVGSAHSSNSRRLAEVARAAGSRAYLVDGASELRRAWFTAVDTVGVTAGASTPEALVAEVVERLRRWGARSVAETAGPTETIVFPLPKALLSRSAPSARE